MKSHFEGGGSMPINWYLAITQGLESMLVQINPKTLQREKEIFGGVSDNQNLYYCPDDVNVPIALVDTHGNVISKYLDPTRYSEQKYGDFFTIESINGVKYIKTRNSLGNNISETPDRFESVTDRAGITNLFPTDFGSTVGEGSLKAVFTPLETTLTTQLSMEQIKNVATYIDGIFKLNCHISEPHKIGEIKIRLKTDDTNYYEMTTATQPEVLSSLREGMNQVVFSVVKMQTIGSPDPLNTNSYDIEVISKDGASIITIVLDSASFHKTNYMSVQYYSWDAVIDKDTYQWKHAPADDLDILNLDHDELAILEFEAVLRAIDSSSTENNNSVAKQGKISELERKYMAYHAQHPSKQTPITYEYGDTPEFDGDYEGDY